MCTYIFKNITINIVGVTNAANTFAFGAGLTGTTAGVAGVFTIQAVDQFDYNMTIGVTVVFNY